MLTRDFCPCAWIAACTLLAQDHPMRVVVSVEGPKDSTPPTLNREDVMVYLDNQRMQVTGWTPIQNDRASSSGCSSMTVRIVALGTQFEDLRTFRAGATDYHKSALAICEMDPWRCYRSPLRITPWRPKRSGFRSACPVSPPAPTWPWWT